MTPKCVTTKLGFTTKISGYETTDLHWDRRYHYVFLMSLQKVVFLGYLDSLSFLERWFYNPYRSVTVSAVYTTRNVRDVMQVACEFFRLDASLS